MPLYALVCSECERRAEEFCHVPADRGCRTWICSWCGSSMAPTLSVGTGLTWFEEGRGRWITNMGDKPVYVTSHEQHKREMRKAGVDWATPWGTQGTRGWF